MVQVDYATADDTATKNSGDYIPATGRLTFSLADGQIEASQFVRVTFNGDALAKAHETFAVNLSNAVGVLIPAGHGVGTILNDDTRILIEDVTVIEGDGPAFIDAFVDASDDDGAYANDDLGPGWKSVCGLPGNGRCMALRCADRRSARPLRSLKQWRAE